MTMKTGKIMEVMMAPTPKAKSHCAGISPLISAFDQANDRKMVLYHCYQDIPESH